MDSFFSGMGGGNPPERKRKRTRAEQLESLEDALITGKDEPSDLDMDVYEGFKEYVSPEEQARIKALHGPEFSKAKQEAMDNLGIIPSAKKFFRNAMGGQDIDTINPESPKYDKLRKIMWKNKRNK